MGKPSAQDIAESLGIAKHQVVTLEKRGMPVHKIGKAREWFEKNGFSQVHHRKSGGAQSSGPNMATEINAVLGSGQLAGQNTRR